MIEFKRCPKCGKIKSILQFVKNKNTRDGLFYCCKGCQALYYQKNKERELARSRQYYENHRDEKSEYRRKHKKEKTEYNCQYRLQHKKELDQYQREYNKMHKEERAEKSRKYREIHKKEIAEYGRKYRKMHRNEEQNYKRQYYQENRKQKLAQNREYNKTHKEQRRKYCSKQRGLGYNPLNKWKEGFVTHHIDNINVVFIPREVHLKFMGNQHSTTEQHREAILNYYGSIERMITNNPI